MRALKLFSLFMLILSLSSSLSYSQINITKGTSTATLPNADVVNDLQCVLGDCIVSLDFIIFNRWGEIVFQTKTKKECWDGTYSGKLVQSGDFV